MKLSEPSSFLLAASCPHPDQVFVEKLRRLLGKDLDWSEVIRLAIPHGILSLVSRNLIEHASDLIPVVTVAQLERYRKGIEKRNQEQVAELARLVDIFAKAGTSVLPFKGPTLAIVAYGDLSVRESHDLDLWLDENHLATAGELLRHEGYKGVIHNRGVPKLLFPDRRDCQTEFWHPQSGVLVELHDRLRSRHFSFLPPFQDLWNRRARCCIPGGSLPVMSVEDVIPTLAAHGSKHMWRRLSWVADLAGLIMRDSDIDWDLVSHRATAWHCRRRLLSAIELSEHFYGVKVPSPLRKAATQNLYVRQSVKMVEAQIIEGIQHRTMQNFLTETLYQVIQADRSTDGFRVVCSYLRRLFKVDARKMMRPMPRATRYIYGTYVTFRRILGLNRF